MKNRLVKRFFSLNYFSFGSWVIDSKFEFYRLLILNPLFICVVIIITYCYTLLKGSQSNYCLIGKLAPPLRFKWFVIDFKSFSSKCAVLKRSALKTHEFFLYSTRNRSDPESINNISAKFNHSDLIFIVFIEKSPKWSIHLE